MLNAKLNPSNSGNNAAPRPVRYVRGARWDKLGYATKEDADRAFEFINGSTNQRCGRACVSTPFQRRVDEFWWIDSHRHNSRHPSLAGVCRIR